MAHLVHYRTSFFMKTHIILYQILLFSCTFSKLFVSLYPKKEKHIINLKSSH